MMSLKKTHSTTGHYKTYIRIALILSISFSIASLVPFVGQSFVDFLTNNASTVGFLYSILIGFMLYLGILRRSSLEEHIDLELNKIRRIYHLGLHMKKAEPELSQWFDTLKTHLREYADFFKNNSFEAYAKGSPVFRKITYTIYELPAYGLPFQENLYDSLLGTAESVTEARQHIRSNTESSIGYYQWVVLMVVTLTYSIIITMATPFELTSRIIIGVVIFNVLLILHLLYEFDQPNELKYQHIADLYVKNIENAFAEDTAV